MHKLVQGGIIFIDDDPMIRILDVVKLSKLAGVDIRQLSREIMPKVV